MFREQLQAFIALPEDPDDEPLRTAIEETLRRRGVRPEWAEQTTDRSQAGVQERMRETDFVIADITGAQPNVMIEVGMALGMGKRMLLLSRERSSRLPGDLAAQQVAVYQRAHVDSVRKYLELWLRDVMAEPTSSKS